MCSRVHIIHQGRSAFSATMDELSHDEHRYRVRLARPPQHPELLSLEGVIQVAALDDGCMEVTMDPATNGAQRLASACVEAGYGLEELSPARQSLEDLFMNVCYGDPVDGEQGDTGS
jgi:ABC-2 type transport system ATP-binding protein